MLDGFIFKELCATQCFWKWQKKEYYEETCLVHIKYIINVYMNLTTSSRENALILNCTCPAISLGSIVWYCNYMLIVILRFYFFNTIMMVYFSSREYTPSVTLPVNISKVFYLASLLASVSCVLGTGATWKNLQKCHSYNWSCGEGNKITFFPPCFSTVNLPSFSFLG